MIFINYRTKKNKMTTELLGEFKVAFWKRMRDYDSRYTGVVCKKNKKHVLTCLDCMYWTSYDGDNLEKQEKKGHDCVNFKFITNDKDLTICARQKTVHGIKIDMFVAHPNCDYDKCEPCVTLKDYSVMEYIMSRPLEIIDSNYDKIYKRSILSEPLSLAEIKNMISGEML